MRREKNNKNGYFSLTHSLAAIRRDGPLSPLYRLVLHHNKPGCRDGRLVPVIYTKGVPPPPPPPPSTHASSCSVGLMCGNNGRPPAPASRQGTAATPGLPPREPADDATNPRPSAMADTPGPRPSSALKTSSSPSASLRRHPYSRHRNYLSDRRRRALLIAITAAVTSPRTPTEAPPAAPGVRSRPSLP